LRPSSSASSRTLYKDKYWITEAPRYSRRRPAAARSRSRLGRAALLKLMWEQWNDVFRKTLGHAERSLVSELRDCPQKWAHQEPFSSDDAYRALDSMARLLTAVSAPQADESRR
jgi:hypothetical protein